VITVAACTSKSYTTPQGPEGSWWLGSTDGGVFIDIMPEPDSSPQNQALPCAKALYNL